MTDSTSLLRAGDLTGLRQLFAGRVRADPANAAHRLDLADVLLVQGELERADTHLDLAAGQDTTLALPVALTRQLIRAAIARVETFEQRRPPELVAEPDAAIEAALARLAGVEGAAAPVAARGVADGRAVDELLDADDRTADVLEVLTSTGKYVWVPFGQIASLKLSVPERLRDVIWRPAELEVRGGPTGVVYLPAIYHARTMTDAQALGRETDWIEEGADDANRVTGVGLRTFLVGDDALSLGEFTELSVDA